MTLKEQDIVLTTTDENGNKVIQMPITRVENVEGATRTINGQGPDANGNVSIPIPSAYTLPNATSSTLGGVKIGSNITVSSGTISLTKSNVTAALGYTPPTSAYPTTSTGGSVTSSGDTVYCTLPSGGTWCGVVSYEFKYNSGTSDSKSDGTFIRSYTIAPTAGGTKVMLCDHNIADFNKLNSLTSTRLFFRTA